MKYNKKIKLTFALLILVILVSISMYGIISINKETSIKNHAKLLVNNKEQFVQIEKSDIYYKDEMTMNYKDLTDDDIEKINQKLKRINKTGKNIYRIASLHIESNDIMAYGIHIYDLLEVNPEFRDSSNPYTYWWDEFDIVEWDDFNKFLDNDIIGKMPRNSEEIMISNYLADLLIKVGLKPYGENNYYVPESYADLVNSDKYFNFGIADKVKIVGIINYDLSEFKILNDISWNTFNSNYDKYSDISIKLSNRTKNIYNKIYVNKDFIDSLNVNDEIKPDAIWKNKIIKTGVLVVDNTKNGFLKLLNEFKYNNQFAAMSTYSER